MDNTTKEQNTKTEMIRFYSSDKQEIYKIKSQLSREWKRQATNADVIRFLLVQHDYASVSKLTKERIDWLMFERKYTIRDIVTCGANQLFEQEQLYDPTLSILHDAFVEFGEAMNIKSKKDRDPMVIKITKTLVEKMIDHISEEYGEPILALSIDELVS